MDPANGDAKKPQCLKAPPEKESKSTFDEDDEQAQAILGIKTKVGEDISCASSTTSDDSSEDFFQFDPAELNKSLSVNTEIANAHGSGTTTTSPNNGFLSLIDDDFIVLSPPPVNTHFSPAASPGAFTPQQSPAIQTMERSDVYDPNRIPSCIFTRTKSTTPMEWSLASNESLFSIHAGNSSFSRDHFILMGRSGEFSPLASSRLESQTQFPDFSELNSAGPGVKKGVEEGTPTEATYVKGIKDVQQTNAGGPSEKEWHSAEGIRCSNGSMSRRSDCSAASFQSFAFPILVGEGRISSAKVEAKGVGRNSSVKEPGQEMPPQQPPPEIEPPKPASSAWQNKWFPRFSCCSPCC